VCVILFILLVTLPFCVLGQGLIEEIQVQGNERIPRETVLYYFGLYPGYSYDATAVQRGVEALWNSSFFTDIKVDVEREERGYGVYSIGPRNQDGRNTRSSYP
jgi:outer membrane protein assembly factor BamA